MIYSCIGLFALCVYRLDLYNENSNAHAIFAKCQSKSAKALGIGPLTQRVTIDSEGQYRSLRVTGIHRGQSKESLRFN